MKPLAEQLSDFLKALQPTLQTSDSALLDLLRTRAAEVIQQDSAQAAVPADADPIVADAIREGAKLAQTLLATKTRLRLDLDDLPRGTFAERASELPAETIGPFVEKSGRVIRFIVYHSAPFLSLNAPFPAGVNVPGELLLLIPDASRPITPDLRGWELPAGTVWIQSRLLAPGGTGLAGLRISGGELSLDAAPFRFATGLIARGTWTLRVKPEQPQAAAVPACDAEALVLSLPAALEVRPNAAPTTQGGATVGGFGSALTLSFNGAPFREFDEQIRFPMDAAEPEWQIAGNLSPIAQLNGTSRVQGRGWTLPLSRTERDLIGEALHGGSIVVAVPDRIACVMSGQRGGPSESFAASLTFNAQRIELVSAQAQSTGRYDAIALWGGCETTLRFAGVQLVYFRSERGAFDLAGLEDGTVENRWDLPRDATGTPFPFEGRIEVFGLLSSPQGVIAALLATTPEAAERHGLALENLYLTVHVPRRLLLYGGLIGSSSIPRGVALLLFDAEFAVPTLPDPYAANWPVPLQSPLTQSAVRTMLRWVDAATPAIDTQLNKQVEFPTPGVDVASDDPDDRGLYNTFREYLQSQPDFLVMLDVSSKEHLFGVALGGDTPATLADNRLAYEARHVRLFMQPQVQWEPVQIEPNELVPNLRSEIIHSTMNGGPTLLGANTVTLVPALPAWIAGEIVSATRQQRRVAALFSLPFGLKAMARLSPSDPVGLPVTPPGATTEIHEPSFGDLASAKQVRIRANNSPGGPEQDLNPARIIPGMIRQLKNFVQPNLSGLTSVTPDDVAPFINGFPGVPLNLADLSGYGLSTFSEWASTTDGAGFVKAEFRVLNGRTSYEVLQFRSMLYECGSRLVRTVILERHNSGRVYRWDSGWNSIEPGRFLLPLAFEKCVVVSFRNIRRIRITGAPSIPISAKVVMEPVIFDADVELEGHAALVPIYDRPGYVEIPAPPPAPPPNAPLALLTPTELRTLFKKVGPISGPINALIRVAGTLDTQLSNIVSDYAPDDGGGDGFATAIAGSPKLPAAGHWSVMRIDPGTGEVSPVDSRRGVPMTRVGAGPIRFREPADARRTPMVEHGMLMSTESSRVLFGRPVLDRAGEVKFDVPAQVADPYSLVPATGHFPRPAFALALKQNGFFHVGADNHWRIDDPRFDIAKPPSGALLKGGEWALGRAYDLGQALNIDVNSAIPAPFNVSVPPSVMDLNLPQFPPALQGIFKITGKYTTTAGGLPKLENPDLVFSGALEEAKKTLHSLSQMLGLPFNLDVSVTAGAGPSPSFVVHMKLVFRLGFGPDGRVEIGVGKFYGQFTVTGELEAALKGSTRALLSVEFQGDVQQGILPPLLYAGGLFRFAITINETGHPLIELGLGVVASIGGDLIPGLIAVEVTVHYGYMLIPETLQPGVMLGLEARAKLLGGLMGFSFSVDALARIQRANPKEVTIWAKIRVAGSVQVAIFIEEDVDFETQFEQTIPLAALALVPGVGILPAATAVL